MPGPEIRQVIATQPVPDEDGVANAMLRDVLGNKADTALAVPSAVDSMMRYIKGILGAIPGVASSFQEQADVAVTINAINGGETNVFDLNAALTRYMVRSLRLKCADPGANTVAVRVYGLINNVSLEVDSFDITTANFGTYFSLMDMFGLPFIAGDDVQVTVRASAGGPYAVTGQYSLAMAT